MPRPLVLILALALAADVVSIVLAAAGSPVVALSDWGFAASFAAPILSCAWRMRVAPQERPDLALLTAGLVLYLGGNVLFNLGGAHGFPSASDFMWSSLAPFVVLSLAVGARRRGILLRPVTVLDGAIASLAFTGLLSAIVYQPVFSRVVDHGYTYGLFPPLLDIVVVSAVVAGAALRGWRAQPGPLLIGIAFALIAAGDSIYVVQASSTGWAPGQWLDLPYSVGLMLVGVAAWAPSKPLAVLQETWALRTQLVPLAAGATGAALVCVDVIWSLNPVASTSVALLMIAVVARLALAMARLRRVLADSRHEATTDPLTGLGNRRALFDALENAAGDVVVALFDLDGFKRFNDRHGHAAGDDLLAELGGRVRAAVATRGRAYRIGGDEFCVVAPAATAGEAFAGAADALQTRREGIEVGCSWGMAAMPAEAADAPSALRLADERMYAVKNGRPASAASQLRDVLARLLDAREPELHEHVLDVGRLAAAVAERLGLAPHELSTVVHGAELHDVGKLAIPEAILHKPGPLDDDEWAVMRRHTVLGEQLLAGIPALADAARLVRASHERWDGGGYPDGLRGSAIPLGARIIAVCDAFDAIVTDRPYRAGASADVALAELRRCAGTQFDPQVVEALAAELEAGAIVGDAARLSAA